MITPPKTYPTWLFDNSPIDDPLGCGERAVNFLRNIKHPKSTRPGMGFQLDPWMERLVRKLYGARRQDGTRTYKTLFAMIPRGNRKTTLGAGLALLHSIGPEKLSGSQVVLAAADQKQARIALTEATDILRHDRRLTSLVKFADYRNRFMDLRTRTVVEAISADGKTQHGRTPAFVLMDELHAWPKEDLWEALKTGLIKTPGSLNAIITTAGRGQDNVGFRQYDYARSVALGEIDDPSLLPVLFEPPAGCEWQDEEVWHLVNPGLSCTPAYPDIDGLRQYAREVANRPQELSSFKQLNLNIWAAHSREPLFDMALFDKCAFDLDLAELEELPCFLGIDLSLNGDLTAVVAAWRRDDGCVVVYPWFFLPGDDLEDRADRDGVPYATWARDGLIKTIEGPIVEPSAIEDHVRELCARFDVHQIAFDPHMARTIMQRLYEDGLPVVEFRQGWQTMAPAIAELERAVAGQTLRHSGHPVLRHHFDSVAVTVSDADIKRLHKTKRRDRIDGAVATVMAVGIAAANDNQKSFWETEPVPEVA